MRLDRVLPTLTDRAVRLIKIDVEGFETHVLRSLEGLVTPPFRPTIICEITPEFRPENLGELAEWLAKYGYGLRDVLDPRRAIDLSTITSQQDVLLMPGDLS